MITALLPQINHIISVSGALPQLLWLTFNPHNLLIVLALHGCHAIFSLSFAFDTACLLFFVLDSTSVKPL
jgi:hypothetical protein